MSAQAPIKDDECENWDFFSEIKNYDRDKVKRIRSKDLNYLSRFLNFLVLALVAEKHPILN